MADKEKDTKKEKPKASTEKKNLKIVVKADFVHQGKKYKKGEDISEDNHRMFLLSHGFAEVK